LEPASVHLPQVFDEHRGSAPMRGDEDMELAEQRVVRKA